MRPGHTEAETVRVADVDLAHLFAVRAAPQDALPDGAQQRIYLELNKQTKFRIEELLKVELELPHTLNQFSYDQAARLLTIHKSKGIKFGSVIILGIENEEFFGKQVDKRCIFFAGVPREKRQLVLTHANQRPQPPNYNKRWDVIRKMEIDAFKKRVGSRLNSVQSALGDSSEAGKYVMDTYM